MPEAIISAKGTEAPTVRSGRFTWRRIVRLPVGWLRLRVLRLVGFGLVMAYRFS